MHPNVIDTFLHTYILTYTYIHTHTYTHIHTHTYTHTRTHTHTHTHTYIHTYFFLQLLFSCAGVTWLLFDIVADGGALLVSIHPHYWTNYILTMYVCIYVWYIWYVCMYVGRLHNRWISGTDDNITSQSSLRDIFSRQMIALVMYTPECLLGILGSPRIHTYIHAHIHTHTHIHTHIYIFHKVTLVKNAYDANCTS